MTIDYENSQPIRQAMTAICGLQQTKNNISFTADSTMWMTNVNSRVSEIAPVVGLMDLSGEGFISNGSCYPYSTTDIGVKYGLMSVDVSNSQGYFDDDLYVQCDQSLLNTIVTVFLKDNTGKRFSYRRTVALITSGVYGVMILPNTQSWTANSKVIIERIVEGRAAMWDSDDLIGYNLALRAVETKKDNPALQESEISFTAYTPDDSIQAGISLDKLFAIGTPIFYTCGYPGDMSTVRWFYLDEKIDSVDHVITVKGADATSLISDVEFDGIYTDEFADDQTVKQYADMMQTQLSNRGITATEISVPTTIPSGSAIYGNGRLIEVPCSMKEMIAHVCNLHRAIYDSNKYCLKYRDAGIPQIIGQMDESNKVIINDIADLTVEYDKPEICINVYSGDIASTLSEIESKTTEADNEIVEINYPDYYYVYRQYSGGTIQVIKWTMSKFIAKVANAGSTIIAKGYKMYKNGQNTFVGSTSSEATELMETYDKGIGNPFFGTKKANFTKLIENTDMNYIYKFTWKGDPRLQPGDYISVKINGQYKDMTIDTITLDSSDGGLKSEITARGGLI